MISIKFFLSHSESSSLSQSLARRHMYNPHLGLNNQDQDAAEWTEGT